MTTLKINRINKSRFQVKNGDEVLRECASYKEAMNAMIDADLNTLNNVDEFYDTDLEDMDLIFQMQAVA